LLFDVAKRKLDRQLDVVNIINGIEQLRLLSKGLLNHKQKFWLKFQKEQVIDLGYNSEEDRDRREKEDQNEARDLISGIHKNDKRSLDKVKKMLQYLKNSNRSTFDLKIIQGLFEEYVSDSDEEVKKNAGMNTEEIQQEFYSLAAPPIDKPTTNSRKKQFNSKYKAANMFDMTSLRQLYKNDEGLVSLGPRSISNMSSISKAKKMSSSRSKSKKASKQLPFSEILEKRPTTRIKNNTDSLVPNSVETKLNKQISNRVIKIKEFSEEQEEDSDDTFTKKNHPNSKYEDNESILDPDQEDFIERAEKKAFS